MYNLLFSNPIEKVVNGRKICGPRGQFNLNASSNPTLRKGFIKKIIAHLSWQHTCTNYGVIVSFLEVLQMTHVPWLNSEKHGDSIFYINFNLRKISMTYLVKSWRRYQFFEQNMEDYNTKSTCPSFTSKRY